MQLRCDERKRYKSAQISMCFTDLDSSKDGKAKKDGPSVVQWGPFKKETRNDVTEERITINRNLGASAGFEKVAKCDVSWGRGTERERQQRYFRKSSSEQLYDEKRGKKVGVRWSFTENQSQDDGIEPDFHLAILVKTAQDAAGKALPFAGHFALELQAGLMDDLAQKAIRFFVSRDDPVFFDPHLEMQVDDTGRRIRDDVLANRGKMDFYEDDANLFALLRKINTEPSSLS